MKRAVFLSIWLFFISGDLLISVTPADVLNRASEIKNGIAVIITEEPRYPESIRQEGVYRGHASFAIWVDEEHRLVDYLLIKTTEMAFAQAVERVLPEWKFRAVFHDGEFVPAIQIVRVDFESSGNMTYLDTLDSIPMLQRKEIEADAVKFRPYRPSELDEPLSPIERAPPKLPSEALPDGEQVHAVFKFYIDQTGRVRMPVVRMIDGEIAEYVLVSMEQALLRWRFEPPTVNGEPVLVVAAQTVTFRPG